jgi:hypothetical protein
MSRAKNTFLFPIQVLLLLFVLTAMLIGGWAALQRAGWELPSLNPSLVGIHGVLMIGVFSTLISLERAVAVAAMFNQTSWHWAYFAPLLSAIGVIMLILFGAHPVAKFALLAGSVWFVWVYVYTATKRHYWSLHTYILSLGAILLVIGNLAWALGSAIFIVVHLWIAFLVVTIVSERLELSRVRKLSANSERLLLVALAIYSGGAVATLVNLGIGIRIVGVGMIVLALWLLKYDIARRAIHRQGLTRYIGWCMLVGYFWLSVAGIIAILVGAVYAGFQYDMLLHAVVVGFVFSMIFGHAPIIFPALTRREIRFSNLFYGCLVLLHVAVIIRIWSDISTNFDGRMWASLLNAVAVCLFLVLIPFHIKPNRVSGAGV